VEASHPEQGTLHAWVEGELDSAEHQRVEAHLAECARCSEAVAEARGLIAGASRIVAALDGAPAGVVPSRMRRPRFVPARWAAAAAVLLFAATSVVVSREFTSRGDELLSAGNQAAAASEQGLSTRPAVAPAVPEESPPTITNAAGPRRSPAPPAREPIPTVAAERTRAREVRDGRAASVDEVRELSGRARAVAVGGGVRTESDLAGRGVVGQAAGQIANAAPGISAPPPSAARPLPPPPSPPPPAIPSAAESRQSLERSQRGAAMRLQEVVVADAGAEPVGSRSDRVVRVVRYEARPGVIVTLTEYEEPPRPDERAIRIRGGQARPQAAAARPEPRELSTFSAEQSYTWHRPERGRFYVLRGPLPPDELESLARRLSELKVVR
jgi:hypothetical protein